ncbi:MAG: CFI-box-CTERM domain-containing protein [Candidatus Bathyarchaeia archaeon]
MILIVSLPSVALITTPILGKTAQQVASSTFACNTGPPLAVAVTTDKLTYRIEDTVTIQMTANRPVEGMLTISPPSGTPSVIPFVAYSSSYVFSLTADKVGRWAVNLQADDFCSGFSSAVAYFDVAEIFDFALTANGDISVVQGQTESGVSISATLISGVPQSIGLSCSSGLPNGAFCIFNPSSGTPSTETPFSSALTVSTLTSTPHGTYPVTVIGVAGNSTRATSFSLTVIEPTLTTSVATGGGSVNPYCPSGCLHQAGQSVSITSTPGNGWEFSSWNGGYCSAGALVNPCSVVMNGDVTVSANFNMPTISDRAINVIYWLLGQEQNYTQGKTTFAEALTSDDRTRAYTDSNARLALALTYELEYVRKNSEESTWCGSQNCPNLYDKIKVALQFVLASQTATTDFYYYWDLSNSGWQDSGKLYYWNAAVLEGLAIVATKMRWNGLSPQSDYSFYDHVIQVVEETLNTYQGSKNSNGSWNFWYQNPETVDTHLMENGELLAALVAVTTYELNLAGGVSSRNAQIYGGWAQSLATWLLGLQEIHTDRTWSSGGGYGGFYDSPPPDEVEQYSLSNGRAVFGLALYGFNNASIFQPNQAQIRNAIQLWLDDWVNTTHDQYWGPFDSVYSGSSNPPNEGYPKSTNAAAALGTTTTSFFLNEKYMAMAKNFYLWATGKNELQQTEPQQTDLQNVWDGRFRSNVGFEVDIKKGPPSINPSDSNVETNLEMLQLMVALSDPRVIWNMNTPTPKCVIATAAYGSELAAPVQFLRNFRDNEVQKTTLGAYFMTAFNHWYYSWAPTIAQQIAPNENYKAATRVLISPLIGSLYVSHMVFAALAPASPELAVLLAGLLASAILGLIYLGPVYGLVWKLSKRRMTKRTICNLVVVAAALTFLATLTTGTFNAAANLTALAVVETLLLTPALILRKITPVMKNKTAA